ISRFAVCETVMIWDALRQASRIFSPQKNLPIRSGKTSCGRCSAIASCRIRAVGVRLPTGNHEYTAGKNITSNCSEATLLLNLRMSLNEWLSPATADLTRGREDDTSTI